MRAAWHAYAANHTLDRYSFSKWAWEGHPERDVGVLLGFALTHRLIAFFVLKYSKQLRFS